MRTWVMPKLELQGSDKQVKWALDIVAMVYTTANANVKRAHDMKWPHVDKWEEGFGMIISQLEGSLAQIDKAAVIISCRDRLSPERILYLANKYVNK